MLNFKYLPQDFEENLKSYKYNGTDKSLFYKYLLSPFGNFCVNYLVPEWLAPNLITFMGFLCVLIPHLIILGYSPIKFEGNVPSWLCYTTGILHLMYMNFDNIDGKQARKTNNSSPLGLLFDHGCDSLIVMLQAISLMATMQTGNTFYSFGIYLIGCLPFYFTTLEEYYTNVISLPLINGPNEGCIIIAFFFIFTGAVGSDWWLLEVPYIGILRNQLGFYLFLLSMIITVALNFYSIYKSEKLKEACKNMLFFWYMILTVVFIMLIHKESRDYMRIYTYILGFSFGKLVSHLQIAHVSSSPFRQFRVSLFCVFSALNANFIFTLIMGKPFINELLLLIFLLCVVLAIYFHLVFRIINQMTSILGIRCFVVKSKDSAQNYNTLLPPPVPI